MILMKDIIREGHKTLTEIAKPVQLPLGKADKKLLKDLMEFVQNSIDEELSIKYDLRPSVGIAAPQVNVSKRMFVVHAENLDGVLYSHAIINPIITNKSTEIIYLPGGEGCLSVDRETEGLTPRYKWIEIEAFRYDIPSDQVMKIKMRLEGYIAIVFQHEIDHLDGILYVSKLFESLPFAKPAFTLSEDNS